jgi:hypothetical protein
MFIEWPVGNHILYNLEQRLVIVSILRAERIPRKVSFKSIKDTETFLFLIKFKEISG